MTDPLDQRCLQWGFSTLGCSDLSLPEICALAGEFHVSAVELRGLGGRLDLPAYCDEQQLTAPAIRRLCQRQKTRLVLAGSSVKLTTAGEQERSELRALSVWADTLGIPYIRVFGGVRWGEALSDADYARAAAVLDWWCGERSKHHWQVELLLETHDAFSASEPCLELGRRLSQPLHLLWDSHHTWRLGGETPSDSWAQLGPLVRHVHIKDSIDTPSARHPYTYVLPGHGQMPLAEVIGLLRESAFGGCVSLEWERHWHPYLPPIQDALAELQQQPWYQTLPHAHRVATTRS